MNEILLIYHSNETSSVVARVDYFVVFEMPVLKTKSKCNKTSAHFFGGEGGGGGGSGHPDTEIRGGPGLKKFCFRPFGPQFGLNIMGGGNRPPRHLSWI